MLRSDRLPANRSQFPRFLEDCGSARETERCPKSTDVVVSAAERAWDAAEGVLDVCAGQGVSALAFGDSCFPQRLAALQSHERDRGVSLGGFCPVLYYRGSVEALNSDRAVAIVGTREPTAFGRDHALQFGSRLAAEGIVIVSGLARGCDTQAHVGCVRAKGTGVAVMAHGLDRVYPPENARLADQLIASGGCLVSEYPPGAPPTRRAFGFRDRIQAGLADLVIVIETPAKDGTMITVDYARKQGRRVGCLSHPARYAGAAQIAGNTRLLLNGSESATALRKPQDALDALLATQRNPASTDGHSPMPLLPLRW